MYLGHVRAPASLGHWLEKHAILCETGRYSWITKVREISKPTEESSIYSGLGF
jgi:hypothetical protein